MEPLRLATKLRGAKPQPRCPKCFSYNHGFVLGAFRKIVVCYDCMYKEYYEIDETYGILLEDSLFSLDYDDNVQQKPKTQSTARIRTGGPSSLYQMFLFT